MRLPALPDAREELRAVWHGFVSMDQLGGAREIAKRRLSGLEGGERLRKI